MKEIAQLTDTERRELFAETASEKGITPSAAEKDFWVCWALLGIFEHPHFSRVLRFKGGTSLSKCFGLIERFSEDIDLILDWREVTAEDPEAERSKTKQNKFNQQLNSHAQDYIRDVILPAMNESMGNLCELVIDETDKHTINVHYPVTQGDEYLRDTIRLEIGPLAHRLPSASYAVTPFAAEVFPTLFTTPTIMVDTILPERTFWEKITILHAEAHRPDDKPQPARYSRHYYDVYQMLEKGFASTAKAQLDLLETVVAFKQKFYPAAWARYDLAVLPTLTLTPSAQVRESLKKDYLEMREMIFGDYADFDTMMNVIAEFQVGLNSQSD